MKKIGLLGGMTWESTLEYYRILNETVKTKLGGLHSAEIILYSFDFMKMELLMNANRWGELADMLVEAALRIERSGADMILLCTNTMHKLAPQLESKLHIPLIHIVDATAERIYSSKMTKVGLLGTSFTMEEKFYIGRLAEKWGVEAIVPNELDRTEIHRIISEELGLGIFLDESRARYVRIMNKLHRAGAQGIILGCTEIPLLIKQQDIDIPVFDTTRIHAEKAIEVALD